MKKIWFVVVVVGIILFQAACYKGLPAKDMRGNWKFTLKLQNGGVETRNLELMGTESTGVVIYNGGKNGSWILLIDNSFHIYLTYYKNDIWHDEEYFGTIQDSFGVSGQFVNTVNYDYPVGEVTLTGTFTGAKQN